MNFGVQDCLLYYDGPKLFDVNGFKEDKFNDESIIPLTDHQMLSVDLKITNDFVHLLDVIHLKSIIVKIRVEGSSVSMEEASDEAVIGETFQIPLKPEDTFKAVGGFLRQKVLREKRFTLQHEGVVMEESKKLRELGLQREIKITAVIDEGEDDEEDSDSPDSLETEMEDLHLVFDEWEEQDSQS